MSSRKKPQFSAISCEERHHLEAERETLLYGDAKKRPQPVAQPISKRVDRVVHVQQDLRDCADVNHCLEESDDGGKDSATLDNGSGAERVQRHVGYTRDDDEQ